MNGVTIIIDLAEAMDRLSVLILKSTHGKDVAKQVETLIIAIKKSIGINKYNKVITSNEYGDLARCNRELWMTMGRATKDEGLGGAIDQLNQSRFLCKQKLQEKFAKKKLEEVKIR